MTCDRANYYAPSNILHLYAHHVQCNAKVRGKTWKLHFPSRILENESPSSLIFLNNALRVLRFFFIINNVIKFIIFLLLIFLLFFSERKEKGATKNQNASMPTTITLRMLNTDVITCESTRAYFDHSYRRC